LYLISAIYFESRDFASSGFLVDKALPEEKRGPAANTPSLLKKAWATTEKWITDLETYGIVYLRCTEKRSPLDGSNTAFYGTK
jgi:hypothetical protein